MVDDPVSAPALRYRRVLLKLSGEALMGSRSFGVDPAVADRVAAEIARVRSMGVQIAITIGGGNFFRGVSDSGRRMERSAADAVGMLATVMNCLVMQDALERHGVDTRILTALEMRQVAEPFIRRRAIRHLEKGRAVLFGGGTGHPYFSTDTGAALRALEIQAEAILKATKVDGVYTADPVSDPTARKYDSVTYREVLEKGLRVMDATAVAMCMENSMPLHVFSIREEGNIARLVSGEPIGTLVS